LSTVLSLHYHEQLCNLVKWRHNLGTHIQNDYDYILQETTFNFWQKNWFVRYDLLLSNAPMYLTD